MTPVQAVNAIEMKNVSVTRGGCDILRGVNWTLPRGSSCAVLGPNGSGKTTLMRTITGFMWPTTGTVDVLGRRLGETDVRELRRHIAVVDPSERFGVDSELTAIEAVLTGYWGSLFLYETPTAEQIAHADHLIESVGLGHRRDHKIRVLSTGEHRRCLLARSLVVLPEILILDELDISGREHVLATIEQLRKLHPTMTVIMVTHHVEEMSPKTDQVMLLKNGTMHAVGTPAHVITPEMLSSVFGCKVFVQKRSGRWWLEVLPEVWLDLLTPGSEAPPVGVRP
jgi:iron complex transport system ATP-binding protein